MRVSPAVFAQPVNQAYYSPGICCCLPVTGVKLQPILCPPFKFGVFHAYTSLLWDSNHRVVFGLFIPEFLFGGFFKYILEYFIGFSYSKVLELDTYFKFFW